MASSHEGDVRLEEKLKIKIGDAKNLLPKSSSNAATFVAVCLDREEIFRTAIKEKTNCPFFGEEFQFDVPRQFRNLSFCVHEHDKFSKQSRPIGKVSLKKESLPRSSGKDRWLTLSPYDGNQDVQGKIYLELQIEEVNNGPLSMPTHQLVAKNVQCSDLALINNACNPFLTLSLQYGDSRYETKKSKVKMKTNRPKFDESFYFTVPAKYVRGNSSRVAPRSSIDSCRPQDCVTSMNRLTFAVLHVTVSHEPPGFSSAVFLGKIRVPLSAIDVRVGQSAWYFLQPESPGSCALKGFENEESTISNTSCGAGDHGEDNNNRQYAGSLRVKISYSADHVFSFKMYDKLCSLLMESPTVKPVISSAAWILGELVGNKSEEIQPLVRVFLHEKQIIPLIRSLAEVEMKRSTNDPTTIFRGNTLASKCMDEFMRLVGRTYLQSTLKTCLEKILKERKPCEIDPGKITDSEPSSRGETPPENLQNLRECVDCVLACIIGSAPRCPLLMCQMFSVLKELAAQYFPSRPEVKYSVLSGFVFLRFFAPAILTPKLFDLVAEPACDATSTRTLTLLSKTVQTLGNHVSSRSAPPLRKEDYMSDLIEEVASPSRVEAIREFLEAISTFPVQRERSDEPPMLLREGWMMKKSFDKRKKFRSRKGFKRRYFTLTTTELRYAKDKEGKPLQTIPASHILGVLRVDEIMGGGSGSGDSGGGNGFSFAAPSSVCMSNVFSIQQPNDRSLLIQAGNCVEEKEWVDLLNKVRLANANRLERCHPGAFRDGKWDCCQRFSEMSRGCAPVSTSDVRLNIDVEREMERVYSLYVENLAKMEYILGILGPKEEALDSGVAVTGGDLSGITFPVISPSKSSISEQPIWWSGESFGYGAYGRWWEGPDYRHDDSGGVVAGDTEARSALKNTLSGLVACIHDLLQVHSEYFDDYTKKNRLGSMLFPIGDDNYVKVTPVKAGLQLVSTSPGGGGTRPVSQTKSSPS